VNPIINAIASQNFERAVAQAKTADAFLMSEDNNIDEVMIIDYSLGFLNRIPFFSVSHDETAVWSPIHL
jgi:hypothetical protein